MAEKNTSQLERQDDGTLKLTITIPAAEVQKAWDDVLKQTATTANVPGFRKGKAPQKLVEDQINKDKAREEVLRKLLPTHYVSAVQEHKINPIMNPKIQIGSIEDDKDWQFHALTAEMPKVELGDYKKNVKNITAKSKIIVPGQDLPAGRQGSKEPNFDEIAKALMEKVTIAVPKILVEQEVDRMLSQTLNEIKSLGLTLDQYLASTNRTPDDLRAEYEKKAMDDMKLEFALQEIAKVEKIIVDEKEITEAIQKAKDPQERSQMEANRYLLANIIRQQKTIDFVKNL